MTTVAYRDGVLAADTLVSVGDTKLPGRVRKVWKLRNGSLFGGAGKMEEVRRLRKLMAAHKEGPMPAPKLPGCEAILVMPDGNVLVYEGAVWEHEEDVPFQALGSGFSYALTAMWLGHDAVTAVKAGIHFDKGSGGSVMFETLDQIPKPKKEKQ